MANITWTVQNITGATGGFSAARLSALEENIVAAGETWERYLNPAQDVTIQINVNITNLAGSTIATGGTTFAPNGRFFQGQPVGDPASLTEIVTGIDQNGGTADIDIEVDTALLGSEVLETDFLLRTAPLANQDLDLFSVLIHEVGHGLGIASFRDANDQLTFNFASTYDEFFIFQGGNPFFNGAAVRAEFGGLNAPLTPGNSSHFGNSTGNADAQDLNNFSILSPSLLAGTRAFISPLEVALLQDLGAPISTATSGADVLYGFDEIPLSSFLFPQGTAGISGFIVDLIEGTDSISGGGGNDEIFGLSGNDTLAGGAGNDFIRGDRGSDSVLGNAGNDQIFAGPGDAGNDTVDGGTGNDIIGGANGNDRLIGNQGQDTIFGGNGNDTILDNGTDNIGGFFFAGAGTDTVTGNDGGHDTLGGGAGNDTVSGGGGNDMIFGGADAGSDNLLGGNGNDTIFGGQGNQDVVNGGNGNDELFNGAGNDTVIGGGGNDTIFGGGGNDTITGGSGSDVFAFVAGNGDDFVTDFTPGVDDVDLSGTNRNFNTFNDVSNNSQASGGNLIIDTGGGDSVTLQNTSIGSLSSGDFLF